ncbi:formate/nitrite transporter family protein [Demequina globuliformis]|uniref:formate/nitrite transporter family protein n=1 Tax=Demequina globuliformis TaxID=676202 RepID=UPI000781BC67|nr:formate/nitrite transporter family protein [Demequina globuliformis]
MKTLSDNIGTQVDDAVAKVARVRSHPWRFLTSAMMAGLWIGTGVYVMFSAAGPFHAAGSPATKLVSGAVFAIALTFVVFAGGQLATSAMMSLPIGAARRAVTWWQALWAFVVIVIGNLAGSLLLAWVLIQSGIFSAPATQGMLDGAVTARLESAPAELFFRGVMCNILVCGAIWAASRVRSEAAKAIILFWGVFAFISSGFEHVVANMTIFGLGILGAGTVSVSVGAFASMLLWVGLGNLVGGMVVIGMAYLFISGPHARAESGPAGADELPATPREGGAQPAATPPVLVESEAPRG